MRKNLEESREGDRKRRFGASKLRMRV